MTYTPEPMEDEPPVPPQWAAVPAYASMVPSYAHAVPSYVHAALSYTYPQGYGPPSTQ